MTAYSYGQLETLWLDTAKGTKYATDAWAVLMAAIAMAESGGRSDAYNPSGASGLWQILGAVHAADQPQLFNPQVNASEALAKLQSQGLGAWETYTNGAYKQYLKSGVNPASLPTSPGTSGTPASGSGGASLLGLSLPGWSLVTGAFNDADAILKAALWLFNPSNWVRILIGLSAAGLLAFGLFALSKAVA